MKRIFILYIHIDLDMIPIDGYISYCDYGEKFLAAYHKNNIYGTQFHPEKARLMD